MRAVLLQLLVDKELIMWHVGVDLHRKTVVIAAVHDSGEVRPPVRCQNSETERIKDTFRAFGSFRAVVEDTGTYRWFYKLVAPMGTVLLAHPGKASHHGSATL